MQIDLLHLILIPIFAFLLVKIAFTHKNYNARAVATSVPVIDILVRDISVANVLAIGLLTSKAFLSNISLANFVFLLIKILMWK